MAIGEVFKLTCVWRRESNPSVAVNSFYYRQRTALVMDTPVEDLLQAFQLNVEAAYAACVSDYLFLDYINVGAAPGFYTVHQESRLVNGGLAGDPMPPIMAGYLKFSTSDFSRRGRGGIYVPTANEANNTAGKPSATLRDLWIALADKLLADMATESLFVAAWDLLLYSPTDNAFKVVTGIHPKIGWSHQIDRAKLW